MDRYFHDDWDRIKDLIEEAAFPDAGKVVKGVFEVTSEAWQNTKVGYQSATDAAWALLEILDNRFVKKITSKPTRKVFAEAAKLFRESPSGDIKETTTEVTLKGKLRSALNDLDFRVTDSGDVIDIIK